MHIYLPIAEMSVNSFLLLGMGVGVGMLSGMFGLGGGFLMTPLLIFIGIPPAVAVGTEVNQIVASSVSGVLAHWRRGNIDVKMGVVLLIGGLLGSTLGVWLFHCLREIGQVDLVIRLSYVVFLGFIGVLMLIESGAGHPAPARRPAPRASCTSTTSCTACRSRCGSAARSSTSARCCRCSSASWSACWRRSSGVGGGILMVPAMIYLLGMPTGLVVGTSLFQIIFVTANATFLQAFRTRRSTSCWPSCCCWAR